MQDIKDFLPGWCQGVTRVFISYPFDALKVFMQKSSNQNLAQILWHKLKTDPRSLYRGASLGFLIIPLDRSIQFFLLERLKKEGWNSFLSGLGLGVMSAVYNVPLQYVCTNTVLMPKGSYAGVKHFIQSKWSKGMYKGTLVELSRGCIGSSAYLGSYVALRDQFGTGNFSAPVIGACAGTISWFCMFPLDTIRTDLQTTDKAFKTAVSNRFRENGFRNFYRGITPVLIRTTPSAAAGMFVYENVRRIVAEF